MIEIEAEYEEIVSKAKQVSDRDAKRAPARLVALLKMAMGR